MLTSTYEGHSLNGKEHHVCKKARSIPSSNSWHDLDHYQSLGKAFSISLVVLSFLHAHLGFGYKNWSHDTQRDHLIYHLREDYHPQASSWLYILFCFLNMLNLDTIHQCFYMHVSLWSALLCQGSLSQDSKSILLLCLLCLLFLFCRFAQFCL